MGLACIIPAMAEKQGMEGMDGCKGNQWLMINPLGALFREWAGRV